MSAVGTPFKSLFLPLKADDHAVFAAVCPLLTLSRPRPPPSREVRGTRGGPDAALFSPAEGNPEEEEEEEEGHGGANGGVMGMHRSALFAVLSGRADGAVAVLRSRDVVFFSLSHRQKGPVELCRFAPLPTTREVRGRNTPAASSSSTAAAAAAPPPPVGLSTATCASLLPLELTYLSRVEGRRQARGRTAASVYMRGLVGFSDGRVSAFSETSYTFGFAAHDCPVVAVHAIYVGSEGSIAGDAAAASPPASPTNSAEGPSIGFVAGSSVRAFTKAMQHLGFVTAGKNGSVFVWRQLVSGMVKPKPLRGATSIHRAAALCICQPTTTDWFLSTITADPDSLGRRRGSGDTTTAANAEREAMGSRLRPNRGGEGALPAALATFPSLSMREQRQDVAASAEGVMMRPVALYAVSGVRHCIRSELLSPYSTSKDVDRKPSGATAKCGVHDYVLPDLSLSTITVIATDGELCALSYAKTLRVFPLRYLKPLGEGGEGEQDDLVKLAKGPVFTAKKAITHVVLSGGLCVVACGSIGLVYVLLAPSFRLLGEFYTYKCRPVASLAVYPSARLIAVVDTVCGSAELVQVQEASVSAVRAALATKLSGPAMVRETYASLPEAVKALPTVVALRCKSEVEGIAADIVKAGNQTATTRNAVGQWDALTAHQEAMQLSARAIPTACEAYMYHGTSIL